MPQILLKPNIHYHAFNSLQINATTAYKLMLPSQMNLIHILTLQNLRRFLILYYHLRHALQSEIFIRFSLKSSDMQLRLLSYTSSNLSEKTVASICIRQ